MTNELKPQVQGALAALQSGDLSQRATALLQTLGYRSQKIAPLSPKTGEELMARYDVEKKFNRAKARLADWKSADVLFQLTDAEVKDAMAGQGGFDFQSKATAIDNKIIQSYVFLSIELPGSVWNRGDLAAITREVNRLFPMPAMLLFRHGDKASIGVINRRLNKKDESRDVLEKVTLIKDIRLASPHRAHIEILHELALPVLRAKYKVANFVELHEAWRKTLDIQTLNKAFYGDYKSIFDSFEQLVPITDPEKRRLWTQRLFNRLIFLRFLEKKGWLSFHGNNDFLRALWNDANTKGDGFATFRLPLLWNALNTPNGVNLMAINGGGLVADLVGQVPYLNGGLFEPERDGGQYESLPIENEAFAPILNLFDRYYFTVAESTPIEEEVGIDPEMLGKVFEELVTGRHESGSYYTPRGIVSFMGREALKGYLEAIEAPQAVANFVDKGDPHGLRNPRGVEKALAQVKICDPACGSGAYLLGMMQELIRLREALFAVPTIDHKSIYDLKLEIIAGNLYGVDKDPFAAGIAMLRLWLSLMIDYEGETPEPLPNLSYKIEVGDSLAAPLGMQKTLDSETVAEFNAKKSKFVKAHGSAKMQLRGEIEELRTELKTWSHAENGFDWRIEFAEVFTPLEPATTIFGTLNLGTQLPAQPEPGGFDIVLANPPYVRQELITEQKPQLKKIFGANFSGTADLYVFFYLRAHELLKPGGMIAFISPNKWFRAAYGAKMRKYFAEQSAVRSITDFGDLPVFESATAYPMIFVAQRHGVGASAPLSVIGADAPTPCLFTQVKTLGEPYPDVRAVVDECGAVLPPGALDGENWHLSDAKTATRLESMRKSGVPLGEYVKGQIYRGVLTGFNEAFVIDEATRDALIKANSNSADLIKPLVAGRDIRKWAVDYKKKWLIVTKIGMPIKDYPAIFQHLKQWQPQLEKRQDQGNHWWELRACAYYSAFDKPKILYQEIATFQAFAYETQGAFTNNKCFLLPTDELYLLGVLNAVAAWQFLNELCGKMVGGAFAMQTPAVFQLPIPTPGAADRTAIEALVAACLAKKGAGCEGEEAEINARVAALYGL